MAPNVISMGTNLQISSLNPNNLSRNIFPTGLATCQNQNVGVSIARIKEMFGKVELSVSAYDTAWVAMVPSMDSPNNPCFPQCLNWLLENQHPNGSWSLYPTHPLLVKDSLSSTLACVLALHKWKVGEQLVRNGLDFIQSNKSVVFNKHQSSPIGFNITFSGMIDYAHEIDLHLPLDLTFVDQMLCNRKHELQRENVSTLAYVAEGLDASYDWNQVMFHQRSNGSLFNSPAATAGSLIHFQDYKSFDFLQSLLETNKMTVPTVCPFDIYTRLHLVDTLQKLGIDRFFEDEIQNVLAEIYGCWQQNSEDIFLDVTCCAMAFRLLRKNGYEITSDSLQEFTDEERFFSTASLQFKSTSTVLELYKASQVKIFEKELILENIHEWTSNFLRNQLLDQEINEERLHHEVEYTLDYSTRSLDRLEHRRNIELYDTNNFRMLKTSYSYSNISTSDLLKFSVQDFNNCQGIHLEELEQYHKWIKAKGLDRLKFKWEDVDFIYFIGAASHFPPELADARAQWSKIIMTLVFFDDVFDIDGSREELINLIELVKMWDGYSKVGYCSERTEILFSAFYEIINDYAANAFTKQGRCVKSQLIESLTVFLNGSLIEMEKGKDNTTMNEYLSYGIEAFGMALMFHNFFLLGPKLTEEVSSSEEYNRLYKHVGTIGRLFNDYHFSEREVEQRKDNGVIICQSQGDISEEEARAQVRQIIENNTRELLRMVLQEKGSLVPKVIKEGFWKVAKICHYMYTGGDEMRNPIMSSNDIKSFLFDPLSLSER